MLSLKKTILLGAMLVILVGLGTGISARVRENAVQKVKPGMQKAEVETLLGPGKSDISSSGMKRDWPTGRQQFSYRGNPSLWFGRWEDELIVGYTNNIVSDTERCGL
jgi:hypothetical protein